MTITVLERDKEGRPTLVKRGLPQGLIDRLNGKYSNTEENLRAEAEECQCVHMVLDDKGIPRQDSEGNVYSLVGRVDKYKDED